MEVSVLILTSSLQHYIAKKHFKWSEVQVVEYREKFITLDNKVAIVISFQYCIYSWIRKAVQCYPSLEQWLAIKTKNFIGL